MNTIKAAGSTLTQSRANLFGGGNAVEVLDEVAGFHNPEKTSKSPVRRVQTNIYDYVDIDLAPKQHHLTSLEKQEFNRTISPSLYRDAKHNQFLSKTPTALD
jgi:hypothetical protein